jgi:hypothetical protein
MSGRKEQIRAREESICSCPPGYDKPVPEGYIVFRPKTYHLYVGLRPVAVNGGTMEEGVAYSKQLKAYPLANANNPGAGRYIDAFPKTWDTLPKYDLSYSKTWQRW